VLQIFSYEFLIEKKFAFFRQQEGSTVTCLQCRGTVSDFDSDGVLLG
jgi:hypothetical protein